MKKEGINQSELNSLSDLHRFFGLPKPLHPLVSLIGGEKNQLDKGSMPQLRMLNFYTISYRAKLGGKLKYGQGYYDFNEGGLLFSAPNQVIGADNENDNDNNECSQYSLLIHPDFFLSYPLARKIRQYGFFSYAANEALHLSDKEKKTIISIFNIIEEELNSRIDDFSQDVIISQIELLLNYANRFYKRQFITRKAVSNDLLLKLEELLDNCFNNEKTLNLGTPTVQYLSEKLNISPSYLSDMLRALTGKNAQQHIHLKIIEKAKEKLSTTNLTVSEVAYQLGFEYPQSFNRFFKSKTKLSPLDFRRSFN